MAHLFDSLAIKNKTIRNRIVMPPMEFLVPSATGGRVHDGHLEHYGRRAKAGTGLIIVEATSVAPESRTAVSQLGAWSDDFLPGLSRLAAACKAHGAVVLLQLQHLGVRMKKDPMGPSSYADGSLNARGMTLPELKRLQNAYADAARRAARAGFDGVEFHGVHGFLLNQFTSPNVNRRRDEYGGSKAGRLRFFAEMFQTLQDLDPNFIFGYRMPCNQPDLAGGIELAKALTDLGIDLLHVSHCGYTPALPCDPSLPYDPSIIAAGKIKKAVRVPVIACNGIATPPRAEDVLARSLADLVAIGKSMVTDPDWTRKAQTQEPIRACLQCDPCRLFQRLPCIRCEEGI